MNEMHVDAINPRLEMLKLVQPSLLRAPVVYVSRQ
jgi:hypothetical protein